jgi:hypothetical protein
MKTQTEVKAGTRATIIDTGFTGADEIPAF